MLINKKKQQIIIIKKRINEREMDGKIITIIIIMMQVYNFLVNYDLFQNLIEQQGYKQLNSISINE